MIIIEHDPLLYENAGEMIEYVSQRLHDAFEEAAVLFTRLEPISFPWDLIRNADRVFYFDEGPKATTRLVARTYPKDRKNKESASLQARFVLEGKANTSVCS